MNIKPYIDQLPRIAHLDKHQQFTVLEQARDSVFSATGLKLWSVFTLVAPWLCVLIILTAGVAMFSYSMWLLFGALISGLLVSRVLIGQLADHFINKGLTQVLNSQPELRGTPTHD